MEDAALTPVIRAIRPTPNKTPAGPPSHPATPPPPMRQPDTVELSPAARQLTGADDTTAALSDERQALIDRVRGEIAAGSYETEDKLDRALEAMIDRIERE